MGRHLPTFLEPCSCPVAIGSEVDYLALADFFIVAMILTAHEMFLVSSLPGMWVGLRGKYVTK